MLKELVGKKNGCWSDVITNGWTVTQIVRNSWKTGEEILTSVQWEQKIMTWKKTWKSLNVAPPMSEKGILRKKKKEIKKEKNLNWTRSKFKGKKKNDNKRWWNFGWWRQESPTSSSRSYKPKEKSYYKSSFNGEMMMMMMMTVFFF